MLDTASYPERKRAGTDEDIVKESQEFDSKKHSTLNNGSIDLLSSNDENQEQTWERFWIVFLFGCCTCVNQCGWIQIAPVFMLCEDVSSVSIDVLLTCLSVALWSIIFHREPNVVLIHGSLPSHELPLRLRSRKLRTEVGRCRWHSIHYVGPLDQSLYKRKFLRCTSRLDCNGTWAAITV